jgi:hypothetical protein
MALDARGDMIAGTRSEGSKSLHCGNRGNSAYTWRSLSLRLIQSLHEKPIDQ